MAIIAPDSRTPRRWLGVPHQTGRICVSPPVIIERSRCYGTNIPPEARRCMSPSVHREGLSVTDAELVTRLKANDESAYRIRLGVLIPRIQRRSPSPRYIHRGCQ